MQTEYSVHRGENQGDQKRDGKSRTRPQVQGCAATPHEARHNHSQQRGHQINQEPGKMLDQNTGERSPVQRVFGYWIASQQRQQGQHGPEDDV